jgi:2-hydroxychromene-2-carboxylate isomerase
LTRPSAQFLYDFGSPNAYLSHRVIPQIEARTGIRFEYVPVLLGGLFKLANNRSPVEAFADIPNKLAYERLEMQRFIARHGLTAYRHNPHFPVNTLQIMRGAAAAAQDGQLSAYNEAMFSAMWEQGLKMDDPALIRSVLDAAGLDGARTLERIQDGAVKAALLANTQQAYDRGAFGSPTFFVGEQMYFGKDKLAEVEREIVQALNA